MITPTTSRQIIICLGCEGSGTKQHKNNDGWYTITCPDCNGEGRLKKIIKTNYEKINQTKN